MLFVGGEFPILVSLDNSAWDIAVRILAASPIRPQIESTFIDVDARSWADDSWGGGEPLLAPRAKIAELILRAAASAPRAIIVDILLDQKANAALPGEPPIPKADPLTFAISEVLDRRPGTHILFARSVREPFDRRSLEDPDCGKDAPSLRSGALDELIASHPDRLHNMAPYYTPSRDGVVRAWRLWSVVCTQAIERSERRWVILPSPQLLIWLIETFHGEIPGYITTSFLGTTKKPPFLGLSAPTGRGMDAIFRQLIVPTEDQLSKAAPLDDCAGPKPKSLQALIENEIDRRPSGPADAEQEDRSTNSRIDYRFRWKDWPRADTDVFPITVVQAKAALDRRSLGSRCGVVVIGQSFIEAADRHGTPLGNMPGSYIILNSIQSLLFDGPIREPGLAMHTFLTIGLILLPAFCFAVLPPFLAKVQLAVFVGFGVILLTAILLWYGMWFNFALPIEAMYVHNAISDYEEYRHRKRRRKKPPALTLDQENQPSSGAAG